MMTEHLKLYSGKLNTGLKTTSEAAKNGANAVYTSVMNNPKAASAVVLGAGAAAALLWIASRNGTFSALYKRVLGNVRRAPTRARRSRAAS
jgi:hypothetical protein